MTENRFRRDLIERMNGRWLVAIHRENNYNPGVPDLSFVMVAPGHETGWLELKISSLRSRKPLLFKVEPSQHQWMTRYAHRVPTYFLIKVGSRYFLVDGRFHNALAGDVMIEDLARVSTMEFTDSNLVTGLTDTLSKLTRRNRYES